MRAGQHHFLDLQHDDPEASNSQATQTTPHHRPPEHHFVGDDRKRTHRTDPSTYTLIDSTTYLA
jgi:hypothetical protein